MTVINTPEFFEQAFDEFYNRTSARTGKPIKESTKERDRRFFTPAVVEVISSGLCGDDLMRHIDQAIAGENKTCRSIGMTIIAYFCSYHGLIDEAERIRWRRVGHTRDHKRRPLEDKILSPEDLRLFFEHFNKLDANDFVAQRLHLWCSMLIVTGARRAALTALRSENVRLTETTMTISIPRLKTGYESKQSIHIPLDTMLPHGRTFGEVLYMYLGIKQPSEYLFVMRDGEWAPVLQHILSKHVWKHGRKAGCTNPKITPHMFRFTCATIIADTVGIRQAQQLLGHSSITTTQLYANKFFYNNTAETISQAFAKLQGVN
jgi:integrase